MTGITSYKQISADDFKRLKSAIGKAEKRTSGEIRVFIEDNSASDPLDRAAYLFDELGINKTEQRNGILIYLAVRDRKYSIIGDYGIHEKVGTSFWERISSQMVEHFREQRIADGLIAAVDEAGKALSEYFPYRKDDINELPDDIVFGDQSP